MRVTTEDGGHVRDPLLNTTESEESPKLQEDDDEWATRILTSRPFADLLSTWHEARPVDHKNQKLPTAHSLTAEKMAPYLEDISIFDCISDDEVLYRFVGTRIAERMGHDVTGENLLCLTEDPSRIQIREIFSRVLQAPQIVLLAYINTYASGRYGAVISLLLPIESPANMPPRIIALHTPTSTYSYLNKRTKIQIGTTIDRQVWFSI